MISPLQAAQACYDLYAYHPKDDPGTVWDYVSAENDEVFHGVTIIDGTVLVVFRGAANVHDFLHALDSFANPLDLSKLSASPITNPLAVEKLGPVHPGAWLGLEPVLHALLARYPGQKLKFTGHSLGAMRATLATAALTASGLPVEPRCVFGEPKSGFAKSASFAVLPGSVSYLATDGKLFDPLWGYPLTFWPELYVHATKPTKLLVKPDGSAPPQFVGPLALHYMGYMLRALQEHAAALAMPRMFPSEPSRPVGEGRVYWENILGTPYKPELEDRLDQ